jgi:hypothetical protein
MSAQNPTLAPQPVVNNPTLGSAPAQAPALAPLSLEDLVYLLTQSVQDLNATVATLSTLVSMVVGALSRQNGSSHSSVVEKPTSFKGKNSESAHLSRSAFCIWVESNKRFFQHWPNGTRVVNQAGEELLDEPKMITLALSFMTKDATVWARLYLEQLMDHKPVFDNGKWDSFLKAFKQKFEPISASMEAKNKLYNLRQGKWSFAFLESEFNTWAPRTDWSEPELIDRFKATLTNDYIHWLLYFLTPASTLTKLRVQGHQIDAQINNLQNNLHMANHAPKASVTGNSSSAIPQPFRNPNAMDIDAFIISKLTNLLSSVSTVSDICKIWQKYMTPHCSCCGSTRHKYTAQLHPNVTCNHCHRPNHYTRVCLTWLLKSRDFKAASQRVTASAPSVSFPSPAPSLHAPATISASIADVNKLKQENAQLKNSVALFQKQIAELQASIAANF